MTIIASSVIPVLPFGRILGWMWPTPRFGALVTLAAKFASIRGELRLIKLGPIGVVGAGLRDARRCISSGLAPP
jgi:hypothetical protein